MGRVPDGLDEQGPETLEGAAKRGPFHLRACRGLGRCIGGGRLAALYVVYVGLRV